MPTSKLVDNIFDANLAIASIDDDFRGNLRIVHEDLYGDPNAAAGTPERKGSAQINSERVNGIGNHTTHSFYSFGS